MTDEIATRLSQIQSRIADACARAARRAHTVQLLAVSKTFPASAIAAAAAAGQNAFGESYLQDALARQPEAEALAGRALAWHFIGPVQSNKTAAIAGHFAWVHGVDRAKIARRLSAQRPEALPRLNVCVQVNVSGEASKSGCAPHEAADLCTEVAALPRLQLRGLMCIPKASEDPQVARPAFAALRRLFVQLREGGDLGDSFDTLSMGMSGDFEIAIEEGATLVRVGSAIFGKRQRH